eukprot:gene3940-4309_t
MDAPPQTPTESPSQVPTQSPTKASSQVELGKAFLTPTLACSSSSGATAASPTFQPEIIVVINSFYQLTRNINSDAPLEDADILAIRADLMIFDRSCYGSLLHGGGFGEVRATPIPTLVPTMDAPPQTPTESPSQVPTQSPTKASSQVELGKAFLTPTLACSSSSGATAASPTFQPEIIVIFDRSCLLLKVLELERQVDLYLTLVDLPIYQEGYATALYVNLTQTLHRSNLDWVVPVGTTI